MKVSELWLREWVNPSLSREELAARLTMAGLEVDSISPVAGEFSQVIVAQVLRTKPHPAADKLTLCDVDIGDGCITPVVCGATNVRAGLKVAMALPGAALPGGIVIKKTQLRGEPSEGMLCSTSELGIEETAPGIMELAEDAPVGTDLRDYLCLNDFVFDIELTPNRADCLSMLGIAREVAALTHLPLMSQEKPANKVVGKAALTVSLNAPTACPQYAGRIIRGIDPHATTPLWMKERLRRANVRSLHPVVDVTNYVMLELGQPMHAFDLKSIEGNIVVRYAKPKESLVLLDGQSIHLDEKALVIADDQKALAVAGVMGGHASAVNEETTDVFLESAFFNPLVVGQTARKYGLTSDSSQRFERGVDSQLQKVALERATQLLHKIVGGEIGPVTFVSDAGKLPSANHVLFQPAKVKQLTGVDVPEKDMKVFLEALGMRVNSSSLPWKVDAPSYRFDIALDVDLVEEIIRLRGYDKIEAAHVNGELVARKPQGFENLLRQASAFLSHRGYHESITYSFVDPSLQAALYPSTQTMRLVNPLSSELSDMRVGLWPGLIASMVYNFNRQQSMIKLFESGVVFNVNDDQLTEHPCIAGLITGESGALNWSESVRQFDFYDMKGDLQAFFALMNVKNIEFALKEHPALHPGKSSAMVLEGKTVGWLGALHPQITEELQVNHEVILFELSLNPLLEAMSSVRYQPISKYPQIRRDLSLLADIKVTSLDIERAVRDVVSPRWLKNFDIFDVYSGGCIEESKKSIGIALTLQDDSRTLVDAEINHTIDAILKTLNDKFAIILRD